MVSQNKHGGNLLIILALEKGDNERICPLAPYLKILSQWPGPTQLSCSPTVRCPPSPHPLLPWGQRVRGLEYQPVKAVQGVYETSFTWMKFTSAYGGELKAFTSPELFFLMRKTSLFLKLSKFRQWGGWGLRTQQLSSCSLNRLSGSRSPSVLLHFFKGAMLIYII